MPDAVPKCAFVIHVRACATRSRSSLQRARLHPLTLRSPEGCDAGNRHDGNPISSSSVQRTSEPLSLRSARRKCAAQVPGPHARLTGRHSRQPARPPRRRLQSLSPSSQVHVRNGRLRHQCVACGPAAAWPVRALVLAEGAHSKRD
ncbi:hypothetical protein FGB62_16g167 [Gracilaria domingensis]|nr:hypothetical protein FGB62_16g167 [Gracilaria domingensis]